MFKLFKKKKPILNNSIFTLHPYKMGRTWVFDDDRVGLKAEAFVAGATEYLDFLTPTGAEECTVIFSPNPFPDFEHIIEMDMTVKVPTSKSGTYYYSGEYEWSLWLCPALFLYLPEAPKKIYLKVTE